MIQKGSIVQRLSNDRLVEFDQLIINETYPPVGALCVVVSRAREKDVMHQRAVRKPRPGISLAKVIDVLYEGRLYTCCVKSAFKEIKSHVPE